MPYCTAALSILFALLLGGCQRPASETGGRTGPDPAAPPAPAPAPAPALSWEQQMAAVRSGSSTEIRVETPVTAAQWSQLAEGCERLAVLEVAHLDGTGADLSLLSRLPALQQLKLGFATGDDALRHIAAADSLKRVNLPRGEFTDAGLAHLAELPALELLRFRSPRVTDEGLRHIGAMPALRFLHLIDVPVTDAGLPHLYEMQQLESFYLDGGSCTDEGLSNLLDALPELHFHRDQLHLPGDRHSHSHPHPHPH